MPSSRPTIAFVFFLAATLCSLYVLISLPDDASAVRIGMAATGFLIFLALFAALVIHRMRAPAGGGSAHDAS